MGYKIFLNICYSKHFRYFLYLFFCATLKRYITFKYVNGNHPSHSILTHSAIFTLRHNKNK